MIASLRVVFVALLLLALSAVFAPGAYDWLAEASLEPLGVLDQARRMDEDFGRVAEVSGGLLDFARDLLGRPAPPAETGEAGEAGEARGFFEGNLARLLVPILAAALRAAAFVVGVAGMFTAAALMVAARARSELVALRASQAELQARVARLEVGGAPRPEGF